MEEEYVAPIMFLSDRIGEGSEEEGGKKEEKEGKGEEKPRHRMNRIELSNLEAWESFGGLDLDDLFPAGKEGSSRK